MSIESQVDHLKTQLDHLLSQTIADVKQIYINVGYEDKRDTLNYQLQVATTIFTEWKKREQDDEQEMRATLSESVTTIEEACKKLYFTPTDYLVPEGSLIHRSTHQSKNAVRLTNLIEERRNAYGQCQEQERLVLERLRWSNRREEKYVPEHPNEPVPSEQTIREFTQHNSALKEREDKRETYLTSTRASCIDILSQLEDMPDDIDNFTRNFMYSTELDDLSDKFMEQAKSSHEHILFLQESRKQELLELVEKISNIVQRLQLDTEDVPCESELSKTHLEACREQLQRLEELKKASLDQMIARIEEEITQIENECYISDLERLKFERQVLEKAVNKEDKLDKLEKRAQALKTRYTEFIELYENVRKWKEAFDELQIVEERGRDPEILKNRGGALIKHAQQKRKLENRLPKLEARVYQVVDTLGARCPMLNGYTSVEEFLLTLQEEVEADKEAERDAKKVEKHQMLMHESRYGVNTSSMKRSANRPMANSAKRNKTGASTASSSKTSSTASSSKTSSTTRSSSRKPMATPRTPNNKTPLGPTPVVRKVATRGGFGFKQPAAKRLLAPSSEQRDKENRQPGRGRQATQKRSTKDRRSKTPDRLFNSNKPKAAIGRAFNRLPSSGMRRRSKSCQNLHKIQERPAAAHMEKLTEIDDSLVSLTSEQFQLDLASQGRPDNSPFTSSFIASSHLRGTQTP